MSQFPSSKSAAHPPNAALNRWFGRADAAVCVLFICLSGWTLLDSMSNEGEETIFLVSWFAVMALIFGAASRLVLKRRREGVWLHWLAWLLTATPIAMRLSMSGYKLY